MIEAISGIGAAVAPTALLDVAGADASSSAGSLNFEAMLESQLTQANDNVGKAESAIQQLASGQPVELHDVMITLEKARISVQTLIQIRNRVLDVYQDLTRMQI